MTKTYTLIKSLVFAAVFGALSSNAQTYCTQMASSTGDDEIFNVTFGSLNNSSSCSTTGGPGSILNRYSDYTTNVPAPLLMMGMNYPVSIIGGQCGFGSYCGTMYIWIDFNQNGTFTDPGENVWTSAYTCWAIAGTLTQKPGGYTIPSSATPGNTRMRVTLVEGTVGSPCGNYTWGETEDYIVNIVPPVPCSGTPSLNAVVTPTYAICPNANALLQLATTYSTYGFTYQWQSSTVSPVGPFNSIPNGTLSTLNTGSLSTNTYFQAIITCTNGNGVTTAAVGQVSIQPTIISTVPYYEGFEGIINNNDLPNCSWTSTNPNSITRTYTSAQTQGRVARTGNKFASFYYSPTGTNYFYTNGIQLNAGVTYSAALWFKTEYYGYLTWSDMSIMLGASQSTTGLTTIATTGGPAASSGYKSLSNTFTVASSGVYYLAIKGANAGICCAYNLNWDDLEVTIPCSVNSPSMSVSANSSTICAGEPVTLTAGGADTYTWSTGANGSQIIETPGQTTVYSVMGTNTLSGCPGANLTQLVVVNPTPQLAVVANPNVVCSGQPVTITAFGATSYTWNPSNGNNNSITVSPTLTTTYQLIGSNSFGCQAQMSQVVTVRAKPAVTAISDRAEICRGEAATLTGGGAVTYQWASNSLFVQSGQAIVTPNATTIYTLTGTDANGCQNSTTIMQTVQECVGLGEMTTTLAGVKVYPNPTGGAFVVELNNGAEKMVTVSDVTGRVVLTNSTTNETMNVNINNLSNGIYYVKIQSQNAVEVIKVIKN